MTIYADSITNIIVTWKLKALYHGDYYYCQCQGSKKIKEKYEDIAVKWDFLFLCKFMFLMLVFNPYLFWIFVGLLCITNARYP